MSSLSSSLIRSLLKPEKPPPKPVVFPAHVSARALLEKDLQPRTTILDPLLTRGTLAMLYGPRGLGKTFVALGIAWAVASGQGFLRWKATRPHRVLYIDGEMAAVDMKERLRLLGPAPDTLDFLIADLNIKGLPDLANKEGQKALLAGWKEAGGKPDLLVLDNLSSLVGFSRNDPDPWMSMQRFLMMMRRIGVAVLIVHHANKDGHQRGTSRREDILDLVLSIRRPSDYQPREGARFELHFEKARGLLGDAVEPIEARMTSGEASGLKWDWRPAQFGELDRAVVLLNQGLNPSQTARELGISAAKGYRLRKQAVEMGLVER